jgi:hypothetical protein
MKPMPKTWPAPVAEGGGGPFGARTTSGNERGPETWPNGEVPNWAGGEIMGGMPVDISPRDDLGTIRTTNARSLKRHR